MAEAKKAAAKPETDKAVDATTETVTEAPKTETKKKPGRKPGTAKAAEKKNLICTENWPISRALNFM